MHGHLGKCRAPLATSDARPGRNCFRPHCPYRRLYTWRSKTASCSDYLLSRVFLPEAKTGLWVREQHGQKADHSLRVGKHLARRLLLVRRNALEVSLGVTVTFGVLRHSGVRAARVHLWRDGTP